MKTEFDDLHVGSVSFGFYIQAFPGNILCPKKILTLKIKILRIFKKYNFKHILLIDMVFYCPFGSFEDIHISATKG
jgi:hypothetical protein